MTWLHCLSEVGHSMLTAIGIRTAKNKAGKLPVAAGPYRLHEPEKPCVVLLQERAVCFSLLDNIAVSVQKANVLTQSHTLMHASHFLLEIQ